MHPGFLNEGGERWGWGGRGGQNYFVIIMLVHHYFFLLIGSIAPVIFNRKLRE